MVFRPNNLDTHTGPISFALSLFRSTILSEIWFGTLFYALWAFAVAIVDKEVHKIGTSNLALTVLGGLVSFTVSLRTTSAYQKYQDGCHAWSGILQASRQTAMLIWLHVLDVKPQGDDKDKDKDKDKQFPWQPEEQKYPWQPEDGKGEKDEDEEERKKRAEEKTAALRSLLEKRTMVNLLIAHACAVKHACRGEDGPFYEDLYPLIAFLPKYAPYAYVADNPPSFSDADVSDVLPLWHQKGSTLVPLAAHTNVLPPAPSANGHAPSTADGRATADPSELEKGHGGASSRFQRASIPLRPAQNPPHRSILHSFPFSLVFGKPSDPQLVAIEGDERAKGKKAGPTHEWEARQGGTSAWGAKRRAVESNIPLEICCYLSGWWIGRLRAKMIEAGTYSVAMNALNALQDNTTSLMRVRTTPLPFAYQAHLRYTVYIYLLLMPFQLVNAFGWIVIVATAVAASLFLGFLEVGNQIEDPFNYDQNDISLDHFTHLVSLELSQITAQPPSFAPSSSSVPPYGSPPDASALTPFGAPAHFGQSSAPWVYDPLNTPLRPSDGRSARELLEQGVSEAEFRRDLCRHFGHRSEAMYARENAHLLGRGKSRRGKGDEETKVGVTAFA